MANDDIDIQAIIEMKYYYYWWANRNEVMVTNNNVNIESIPESRWYREMTW